MSMSVDEIRNVVLLFSNPSWSGVGTVASTVIRNITAISSKLTLSVRFNQNITVLSSKYASTTNGVIQGLLYVPDLSSDDPCMNETAPYVPKSAVRQKDLPPANYNLMALAPWVSGECARKYLVSAHTDPLRGLIFYKPGNSSESPPSAGSSDWDIQDDGKWKANSGFPVYAVSGMVGQQLMQQITLYSGNTSSVPFGHNLTTIYNLDSDDFVRIWTELVVSTQSNMLGIWVYFLIIVGVFFAIISTTSFLMHFVQAWRRVSLRRRVAAGDVNLEGMGIARLTVPAEQIGEFPLFTYRYEPEPTTSPPASPASPRQTAATAGRSLSSNTKRSSQDPPDAILTTVLTVRSPRHSEKGLNSPFTASTVATDYQPACEICLEPYQNRVTVIRELPCGHIFHPVCIDEFLRNNSSLCPLCKASMLPQGYSPKITNEMVRRERATRRLRDRVEVIDVEDNNDSDDATKRSRMHGWGGTIKRIWSRGVRAATTKTTTTTTAAETELQPQPPPSLVPQSQQVPAPQLTSLQSERGKVVGRGSPTSLARKRMRELASDPQLDDGSSGLTKWQKIRKKAFPGF
ncbi:hypothetical protein B0T26DRAFT_64433 [Lasiosphaeria miniovina]|uniref:RING-type E3 ubiquitin transferase n=1 Tax=Lasiosphaeria miniovina TaxID=1954250 RepID=A0AA40BHG4_9PEZI|nr:uncharacterized protein B0T26DRAFT_64433 [Lasiosphaeria miniovina]KAK0734312.1 hypothetical protein B0T26DRAFT_64433 [Lasiosphaeria miniovina]